MLRDDFQLMLFRLLPKKTVSRLIGGFAKSPLSKPLVPGFARRYGIDLGQAELDIRAYPSLTAFFVRKLRPGLRPVAPGEDVFVSPVDGVVSQAGSIRDGLLIQAKGINYSVLELLGQDEEMAERFQSGTYLTIYLSPRDYHRIHAPIEGRVVGSTFVPGTLFPVNPFGVRAVKGLFARNERLVTYLDTPAGLLALVKVGAIIVGSVNVNYAGITAGGRRRKLERALYAQGPVLAKGDELGRFEFGSTVIMLFEIPVELEVQPGDRVLMGQAVGRWPADARK